jgi:hypothetical protein
MSREMCSEFVVTEIEAKRRAPKPNVIAKIRREVKRLSRNTNPAVQKFIVQMRSRYSELNS